MQMRIVLIYLIVLVNEFPAVTCSNSVSLVDGYVQQRSNRAPVPQSLTLLMNFRDDGTTSFQIMQGSQIVYVDNGFCQHGQLFDPSSGRCRDIYCQELNYKFNGTACIPDEGKIAPTAYTRMSDIDMSLTLSISPSHLHERGNFSRRLNSQMNTKCTKDWNQMFHDTLQNYLDIDYERIKNINYHLEENDEPLVSRSVQSGQSKGKESAMIIHSSSSDIIATALAQHESVNVNFNFLITDRSETSNDTLTSLHVVTLLLLASEFHVVIDLCQNYSVKVETLSIIADRNKTQNEFCSDPDVMVTTKNGIIRRRIRADGEIEYVVEVPELGTTYDGGDYTYLFIVSTHTQQKTPGEQTSQADTTSARSNSTLSRQLVSVCNRQPRIVGRCPDSLVMRIALCEFVQYQNLSIRLLRTNRLYTNREYRPDEYRPDLYVVVCKHSTYNGTSSATQSRFVEKAPGIVSTIATFLSIIALTITLITFTLFSSLRNLPGCNTINLIIALLIAESLFLSQSLLTMTRSSVCLVFALGIHFFYLASFFWMNVMAFDLWKTFHKGFSLYVYEIRERLPFYAVYAWGMPVLIVLIGIILDAKNARFKPCYGRFFRGCYDVCFRTKNDTPLQGCWIESALMRFVLFGCPVAIILIVNFIFYALTVRSIRRGLKTVRVQVERKFQRKKQVVPGEYDVKIYMRMAVLAGFGWTIGFTLFLIPDGQEGFKKYLEAIIKYSFILLNATPGLFIFVVYVCNRRVYALYRQLFAQIFEYFRSSYTQLQAYLSNACRSCFKKTKNRLRLLRRNKCELKQDVTSMEELVVTAVIQPIQASTHFLSIPSNQSLKKNSPYPTLNSTSEEKQPKEK